MTERVSFEEFDREVAAFQVRLQELRTRRVLDGGESGDEAAAAAFLELETAAEELRVAHEELWATGNELARRAPHDRDRDLLRVIFKDLPAAVILLDRSGRIRRVNQRAVDLLGVTADYLSGKPFPVFVDLPARAALRSHLAAVIRGKDEHVVTTSLLRMGSSIPVRLVFSTVQMPADSRPVIIALVLPADGAPSAGERLSGEATPSTGPAQSRPWMDRPQAVRAATRRLDLVTEAARLLLDEGGGAEGVVLHAVATLLCRTFAEWAIIDLIRDGQLTRAAVCGPADDASLSTISGLEQAVVDKAELPIAVIKNGQSRLYAHIEDASIFGEDERDVPFLSAMGAHSALCVPIEADDQSMGAITALRQRDSDPFSLSEQAAMEDVAGLLARTLRSERRLARRSAGSGALREPVSPRALPPPGDLDVAWLHRSPDPDGAVSTGFLEFFPSMNGWGAFLADTPSGGEPAAAYLSMLRQWINLLALTGDDPGTMLTQLNWAMRRLGGSDHLVSAMAAHFATTAGRAQIRLASAGHRSSLTLLADGRVQRTDGGGQPLNGSDDAVVHSAVADLGPGDLLLFYNNALFDTHNSVGDGFGQSGQLSIALARAAGGTAQDALDIVSTALSAFADGGLQRSIFTAAVRFTGQ
ncbi:MAG: SpoIIE family protein phosphatase [Actinomycetota bacterium]|nr:SpoIIE family protein phosphatase [Actinomycetota bacterium]